MRGGGGKGVESPFWVLRHYWSWQLVFLFYSCKFQICHISSSVCSYDAFDIGWIYPKAGWNVPETGNRGREGVAFLCVITFARRGRWRGRCYAGSTLWTTCRGNKIRSLNSSSVLLINCCLKKKVRLVEWPIRRKNSNVDTGTLPQTRENVGDQVMMGFFFNFASDWLKGLREFF